MNIQILDKTYVCEIPVPASSTAQQFFFPTLNNLDGKFTQGLETYPVALMAKAPSGNALVNNNLLESSFVNLFVGDVNQIWNMPLIDFITVRSALSTDVFGFNPFAMEFNNLKIIWAKSYIFVADVTTIAASIQAYVFNIKYTDGVVGKEV